MSTRQFDRLDENGVRVNSMDEYDIVHSYDPNDIDEFECGYVAGLEHLLRELMQLEIKGDLTERHNLHRKILRHLGDIE